MRALSSGMGDSALWAAYRHAVYGGDEMPLEAVQLLYTERAIGRGAAAITTELTQRECFEHGGRGDEPGVGRH